MLSLTPVSLSEANAFVARCHRHHKPVVGHKFSIGCMADGRLVGVAIVGRPVSRYLDNGLRRKSTGFAQTAPRTLAVFFTLPHGGRHGLWAIGKSSPTLSTQKAAQACGPPDGNARGWLAANAGREAAALPPTFTPRR